MTNLNVKNNNLDFLKEIKKNLRPNSLIIKNADKIITQINNLLTKSKINAKCVKGGSTAKGTQ